MKMKKWLRPFVFIITTLVIVCSIVLGAIIFAPGLLLNDLTAPLALKFLSLAGIELKYSQLHLALSNQSLELKTLKLNAQNLCFRFTDDSLSTCFDKLDVELSFKLAKPILRIQKIDHILLVGRSFQLKVGGPTPPATPGGLSLTDFLPDPMDQLKIGFISINIANAEVQSSLSSFKGNFGFNLLAGQVLPGQVVQEATVKRRGSFTFDIHEGTWDIDVKSHLDFESEGWGRRRPLDLKGSIQVATSETLPARIQIDGHFFRPDDGFQVHVKVPRTCFERASLGIKGCIEDLDFGSAGILNSAGVSVQDFSPVHLHSDHLSVVLPKSDPHAKSSFHIGIIQQIAKQVFDLHLHNVNIGLNAIDLSTQDEPASHIRLAAKVIEAKSNLEVRASADFLAQKAQALAQLSLGPLGSGVFAKGHAEYQNKQVIVDVPLKINFKNEIADFTIHPNVTVDAQKLTVQSEIAGRWQGDVWDLNLNEFEAIYPKQVRAQRSEKSKCGLHFESLKELDLDCRLDLIPLSAQVVDVVTAVPLRLRVQARVDKTDQDEGKTKARVAVAEQRDNSDPTWSGSASVESATFKSELIEGHIQARGEFKDFALDSDPLNELKIETDVSVLLPHFQKWVVHSRNSPFAVPAPLNVLDGTVRIESKSSVGQATTQVPINLQTRLSGDQQTFNLDGDFKFLFAEDPKGGHHPLLKGQLILSDVGLELPRIKIEAPPSLFPDSRILTNAQIDRQKKATAIQESSQDAQAGSAFEYNILITTADGKPLRLSSNLALKPIPIALNLTIQNSPAIRGTIEIQDFPAQLFRRNAELKFLKLNLKSNRTDENPITGRVEVKVTDYIVFIDLTGTMKTPIVHLKSDPDLNESQIVSVLLFGKSADQLDADQSQSANNAQSAIADRALGLFSLFYLASTPVESIGYNAQQKAFTAKVRLQEGLSLDIGADQSDVKQVGLNKRLSGSWMIHTFVTNPTDPSDQSVTAMLEKIFRY